MISFGWNILIRLRRNFVGIDFFVPACFVAALVRARLISEQPPQRIFPKVCLHFLFPLQ